jgi:hypothetical protein
MFVAPNTAFFDKIIIFWQSRGTQNGNLRHFYFMHLSISIKFATVAAQAALVCAISLLFAQKYPF